MINNKAKITTYTKYGVENIRKCEEYVNILRPDKSSAVYQQFNKLISDKVNTAMQWLSERNKEYTWNERIDGHLYRLYIPEKDLLLDFEFYPVINRNYNYIRINYDTDIITVLEKMFPAQVINTQELDYWKLSQKATNKFLRESNHSPVYDKSTLSIALVKDTTIYQCVVIKQNRILANVTRRNCSVPYGTYMLLRYLNEMFEIPEILIKDNLDNSYTTLMYELLNLPIVDRTCKKKIWWSIDKQSWHISLSERKDYIPFYFTEQVTYRYPNK